MDYQQHPLICFPKPWSKFCAVKKIRQIFEKSTFNKTLTNIYEAFYWQESTVCVFYVLTAIYSIVYKICYSSFLLTMLTYRCAVLLFASCGCVWCCACLAVVIVLLVVTLCPANVLLAWTLPTISPLKEAGWVHISTVNCSINGTLKTALLCESPA